MFCTVLLHQMWVCVQYVLVQHMHSIWSDVNVTKTNCRMFTAHRLWCERITGCTSLCLLSSVCPLANRLREHSFPRQQKAGRHFGLKKQGKGSRLQHDQCPNLSDECRMSQTGVCVCVSVCVWVGVRVCVCACGCSLQCHWETKHWECSTGMTSSVWDDVCLVCLGIGML